MQQQQQDPDSLTTALTAIDDEAPKEAKEHEGMLRIGMFMGGVCHDYRRRARFMWSDISMGASHRTCSAALFMFFATFASTVALGVVIRRNTKCEHASAVDRASVCDAASSSSLLGVSEYLLMNCLAGLLHACLGCQPLLVLRPTGPITAFLSLLFNVSCTFNLRFFDLLACTGVWVGVLMTVVAGLELSRHIQTLTRFTHDIFAVFVCSIYVVDGIQGIYSRFREDSVQLGADADHSVAESLWALNLTVLLLATAFSLHRMRSTRLCCAALRGLLTDYALSIATLLCVLVSYLPIWSDAASISVERIQLGDSNYSGYSLSPTLAGRPWCTDLSHTQTKTLLVAAVSAVPIVVFFYFDQNVSSLLCQQPRMNLAKGRYFHSSFLCMAVFNIIGPLLGLPFVTGSLPHSPQLVVALTEPEEQEGSTSRRVQENRVAPAVMYAMIGMCALFPLGRQAIESIPNAAVDGILIFVGLAGIQDTQLYHRLPLLLTPAADFPADKPYCHPPAPKIRLFTLLQLGALSLAWALNAASMAVPDLAALGLCFPFVVCLLVPFRGRVLPSWFSAEELRLLDGEE
eukprot:TRINITY_DN7554_c0_g1_i1.p1 TRINITY_DN7554_c0_g1~~TRINITY_DN7554_c0_g1_i1.p1  ORF type:complete len:574 (+),score=136.98 TRINITY_DN7554_c0_g1_i1:245-1966(+)